MVPYLCYVSDYLIAICSVSRGLHWAPTRYDPPRVARSIVWSLHHSSLDHHNYKNICAQPNLEPWPNKLWMFVYQCLLLLPSSVFFSFAFLLSFIVDVFVGEQMSRLVSLSLLPCYICFPLNMCKWLALRCSSTVLYCLYILGPCIRDLRAEWFLKQELVQCLKFI